MNQDKELAVQRMQEFIRENIKTSITHSMLAKVSNYSLWYSARIFKELTGKSVFEYIRMVRLTLAAKTLRDTSIKVIDVAFDFVFDSHEGFTRAFAKEFNITPKAYQRSPIPLPYFIPHTVITSSKKEGEQSMKEVKAVFVQIVDRPIRKAIIRRAKHANDYFEYCIEVPCEIWGVFCSIKEAISEPIGMWLGKKLQKKNTSIYVQGVEVPFDYTGEIPEDCEIISLPETQMMIFQGEPYDDNFFEEEVSQVMSFVQKYNPEVYGYIYDDDGYRFQYEPQGFRGYIEGRTVKKIQK